MLKAWKCCPWMKTSSKTKDTAEEFPAFASPGPSPSSSSPASSSLSPSSTSPVSPRRTTKTTPSHRHTSRSPSPPAHAPNAGSRSPPPVPTPAVASFGRGSAGNDQPVTVSVRDHCALGQKPRLGTLYDMRTKTIDWGSGFRVKEVKERRHVDRSCVTNHLKLVTSQSSAARAEALEIQGEGKLSFMVGEGKLSGMYKSGESKDDECEQVQLMWHTVREQHSLDIESTMELLKQLADSKARICNATHVVTDVTYGARATITFKRTKSTTNETKDTSGSLKVVAKKLIKLLEVSAEAKAKVENKETVESNDMEIVVEGEGFMFDKPRTLTSFAAVLELCHELPSLVAEDDGVFGAPLSVHMQPLCDYIPTAQVVRAALEPGLVAALTEMLEQHELMEDELDELQRLVTLSAPFDLVDRVEHVREVHRKYSLALKSRLAALLPRIRGGEESLDSAQAVLHQDAGSPFSVPSVRQWVKEAKRAVEDVGNTVARASQQGARRWKTFRELIDTPPPGPQQSSGTIALVLRPRSLPGMPGDRASLMEAGPVHTSPAPSAGAGQGWPNIARIVGHPQSLHASVAILPMIPVLADTTLQSHPDLRWSITPALPDGLILNPVSGVICGTPKRRSPSQSYVLKCDQSGGGSGTFSIDFRVVDGPSSTAAATAGAGRDSPSNDPISLLKGFERRHASVSDECEGMVELSLKPEVVLIDNVKELQELSPGDSIPQHLAAPSSTLAYITADGDIVADYRPPSPPTVEVTEVTAEKATLRVTVDAGARPSVIRIVATVRVSDGSAAPLPEVVVVVGEGETWKEVEVGGLSASTEYGVRVSAVSEAAHSSPAAVSLTTVAPARPDFANRLCVEPSKTFREPKKDVRSVMHWKVDGREVIVAGCNNGDGGGLFCFDANTKELIAHHQSVYTIYGGHSLFLLSDNRLVYGGLVNTRVFKTLQQLIRLEPEFKWDAAPGKLVTCFAELSDGRLVSADSGSGSVAVWREEGRAWKKQCVMESTSTSRFNSLISLRGTDGREYVISGDSAGCVRVWDVDRGACSSVLRPGSGSVMSLCRLAPTDRSDGASSRFAARCLNGKVAIYTSAAPSFEWTETARFDCPPGLPMLVREDQSIAVNGGVWREKGDGSWARTQELPATADAKCMAALPRGGLVCGNWKGEESVVTAFC